MKENIRLGILYSFLSVIFSSLQTALGTPLFDVMSPISFIFLQSIVTFFILLSLYGTLPEWNKFLKLEHKQVFLLILFAIVAAVIAPWLMYLGWSNSTANNTFLLAKSEMLFTTIFAIFILKEKVTIHQITGIFVMFVGIYTIANGGTFTSMSIGLPDILIIGGCAFWGVASVVYKKYLSQIPIELILIVRYGIAAFVFGIFLIGFSSQSNISLEKFDATHIAYLLSYCLIYLVFLKYSTMKAFVTAPMWVWSCCMLTAPVLGLLFNFLSLSEVPQSFHYWGSGYIILGFITIHLHFHSTKTDHHIKHGVLHRP